MNAYEDGLKPLALVCYLCGREFGTASLLIHQKTCIRKRTAEQQLLPAEARIPRPEPPDEAEYPVPTSASTGEEIGRYNAEALRIYGSQMPQCKFCKRTFVDNTTLKTHMKSCSKQHDAADMRNNSGKANRHGSASNARAKSKTNKHPSLAEFRRKARDEVKNSGFGGCGCGGGDGSKRECEDGDACGKSNNEDRMEEDGSGDVGEEGMGGEEEEDTSAPRDFLRRGGGKTALSERKRVIMEERRLKQRLREFEKDGKFKDSNEEEGEEHKLPEHAMKKTRATDILKAARAQNKQFKQVQQRQQHHRAHVRPATTPPKRHRRARFFDDDEQEEQGAHRGAAVAENEAPQGQASGRAKHHRGNHKQRPHQRPNTSVPRRSHTSSCHTYHSSGSSVGGVRGTQSRDTDKSNNSDEYDALRTDTSGAGAIPARPVLKRQLSDKAKQLLSGCLDEAAGSDGSDGDGSDGGGSNDYGSGSDSYGSDGSDGSDDTATDTEAPHSPLRVCTGAPPERADSALGRPKSSPARMTSRDKCDKDDIAMAEGVIPDREYSLSHYADEESDDSDGRPYHLPITSSKSRNAAAVVPARADPTRVRAVNMVKTNRIHHKKDTREGEGKQETRRCGGSEDDEAESFRHRRVASPRPASNGAKWGTGAGHERTQYSSQIPVLRDRAKRLPALALPYSFRDPGQRRQWLNLSSQQAEDRVLSVDATPSSSNSLACSYSVADEIQKLVALLQVNILTPEEFQLAKRSVLQNN